MPKARRAPWIGREKNQYNYYVYWYDENSGRVKRRSCGTTDRTEAEKELGRFLIDKAYEQKNESPILTPDQYLISTALRWYAQEHGPEVANKEFLGRAIETLIRFFGINAMVSSITPQVCKRFCRERKRTTRIYYRKDGKVTKSNNGKPISNGTTRRELSVLVSALNHAVNEGRLTTAPKVWLPPEPPNKERYLEKDEIEALLNACVDPQTKLFVLLALNTGARKGALLELTWTQIDFNHRLIYLNPEGRVQTKKKRAIVPINDVAMQALAEEREKLKVLEAQAKQERKNSPLCPNVITYKGNPVRDIKKGFNRSCERAGLKGVTPHTLRHTAGTHMAIAGVDLFLISRLLGHSIQKTTELYAHLHPNYLRGAVGVLANVTPPQPRSISTGIAHSNQSI